MLNAIFYILKTGCQWKDMPNDLPPWKAVHAQFMRWKEKGLFIQIHDYLKKFMQTLGYSGEDIRDRIMQYGIELECIGRKNKKSFEVEPKRWLVERTFAWLGKFRRLSKDYELITDTSLNMIYLGMIRIMSKRLSGLN